MWLYLRHFTIVSTFIIINIIIIIIIIIIYETESTVREGFEIFSFIQQKYLSDELREWKGRRETANAEGNSKCGINHFEASEPTLARTISISTE